MAKLFLLRHLKSQWNKENRFTGWVDVPLAENWQKKAKEISKKIFKNKIDTIYTSPLIRNKATVLALFSFLKRKYPIFVHLDKGKMKEWGNFKDISKNDLFVFVSEALNERYYGKLQGYNKEKVMKKYGEEKVHLWRRSYKIAPPGGESLEKVVKRVVPFYKKFIEKDLKKNKNVLVVASHNSLRALVKHIENISDKDIINLEIPYAGLLEYEIGKFLEIKRKKIL